VAPANLGVHLLLRYARTQGAVFTFDSSDNTFQIERFKPSQGGKGRAYQRCENSDNFVLPASGPDDLSKLAVAVSYVCAERRSDDTYGLPCSHELADALHRAMQEGRRIQFNFASRQITVMPPRREPITVTPQTFHEASQEVPLAVIELGSGGLADVSQWQPLLGEKLIEILKEPEK
jgi:hypothetical protein